MNSASRFLYAAVLFAGVLIFQQAGAQERLRVGVLPFSESLAAVIADKQGFFEQEGLGVTLVRFDSGAIAVPVLQSGRIDIVLSNTIATLQAIEQGLDAMVLAPGAIVAASPPDTTTALIARKDAIRSIKELEGRRVAVNVINSSAWLHAVAALDKRGIDHTKVRFTEVPFPQMNDPLLNGQVDAVLQVEPFRSALMATGRAEILSWTYVEAAPNADVTQYIALRPWVEAHREAAAKFVRAVTRGVNFAASNEAATRDINRQFTNLNPELSERVLLPRLGTRISLDELTHTMEMMHRYGLLKASIDLSSRVFKAP